MTKEQKAVPTPGPRTTVSLRGEMLSRAQARADKLCGGNLSRYIQELIDQDIAGRPTGPSATIIDELTAIYRPDLIGQGTFVESGIPQAWLLGCVLEALHEYLGVSKSQQQPTGLAGAIAQPALWPAKQLNSDVKAAASYRALVDELKKRALIASVDTIPIHGLGFSSPELEAIRLKEGGAALGALLNHDANSLSYEEFCAQHAWLVRLLAINAMAEPHGQGNPFLRTATILPIFPAPGTKLFKHILECHTDIRNATNPQLADSTVAILTKYECLDFLEVLSPAAAAMQSRGLGAEAIAKQIKVDLEYRQQQYWQWLDEGKPKEGMFGRKK